MVYLTEIPADAFNLFFEKEYASHNVNSSSFCEPFHKFSEFKKNFANQFLENYYGIHYIGMLKESNNYKFTIVNKRLYTTAKLKFGI